MTHLQKSRARRWLCTLAAVAALVIMLFPVYSIIVGSFESTETLFSGTFSGCRTWRRWTTTEPSSRARRETPRKR